MKILILGGNGLVGHKLLQVFKKRLPNKDYEIAATFRKDRTTYLSLVKLVDISNSFFNIDINKFSDLVEVVDKFKPNIIINCIGLTKKLSNNNNEKYSIYINAYFPHLVSFLCQKNNIKFIHLSTDCIFSGLMGNYTELDNPDALDIYGKTKFLGEVDNDNSLTLRASILGPEITKFLGIYSWFMRSSKSVSGFNNAFFSGFSSVEFANILTRIIKHNFHITGVYHLSSYKISKFDLLTMIKDINNLKIKIIQSDREIYDRTLNCDKFHNVVSYKPPSWEQMLSELKE